MIRAIADTPAGFIKMIIDPAIIILNFLNEPSCMDDESNRHEIAVARSAA
ncbi:hypothetical protein [Acidovorax sp. SUPP3334]|nr:hypothetical protein [Acidovorax sp. SUPP3334]GKT24739.1 hypothetical protein AVHM3334_15715 [Acidovorax sp. SUPP3334]